MLLVFNLNIHSSFVLKLLQPVVTMLPAQNDLLDTATTQRGVPKSGLGPTELFSALTASVWSESRKKVESAYSAYGKIDALRPYFNVEPKEVVSRIIASMDPRPPQPMANVVSELYGPFMACLTLIAVLLFEMKISDHQVQEGTLMGSALITCFGYWTITSSILMVMAYTGKSELTFIQLLSLTGYAMYSICFVLFICGLIHEVASENLFFVMWILVCGCSASKMAFIMRTNIPGKTERYVGAGLAVALHMLFVLYLHFAYHKILTDPSIKVPVANP